MFENWELLHWLAWGGGFVALGAAGFVVGRWLSLLIASRRMEERRREADTLLEKARDEAGRMVEEAEKARYMEIEQERVRFESETAATRRELERLEQKLNQREKFLSRRDSVLTQKEADLIRKDRELVSRDKILKAKTERLDQLISLENSKLERIAGLSAEEARRELFRNLEDEARLDAAKLTRDILEEARIRAENDARNIIANAIQRCAVSHAAETTVSVVDLPSDELKGRIIGREGRNIRTFETATGVEVMIDDTPGAIVISGFDPVRREVAKLAMAKLVADGRIHPARIEEVVAQTSREMQDTIKSAGEEVVLELGIVGLAPELSRMLGRLKYRTSYGQNMLLHSREVAMLAALMAQELDLDAALARRAGLLHDIGKAADATIEGPHARVGAELARRHGEDDVVVNAIAAHHEETTMESPYAFLVASADSISGSRPGARRESFDAYIKRIESLEMLASSFTGVERAYAIQAGREIRVLVEPDKVGDAAVSGLAREVAGRIEKELKYPGQIRVMVVRETRAVDYAH
ncbi:MAG TPA: ribonuclease Y [candidate division WOR-3 bacterium]|uniref:Ribonuclease Y n=1 Tax=candidate division WOR-3 bacterium TaxID=2052148 RepID=A0A7V0T6Q8_UNCW3|nr:ribonuclease Y [candidate division WOR-3 bacterium]